MLYPYPVKTPRIASRVVTLPQKLRSSSIPSSRYLMQIVQRFVNIRRKKSAVNADTDLNISARYTYIFSHFLNVLTNALHYRPNRRVNVT